MNLSREEFVQLSHKVEYTIMCSLLDRATKKMRAITANYKNNCLQITMVFDSALMLSEEEGMNSAFKDIVKDLNQDFESINLSFEITDVTLFIRTPKGNMGWFFWRKD